MSDKKPLPGVSCRVVKAHDTPIKKAEAPTQLYVQTNQSASEWISPAFNMSGLKTMVSHSSILPQCIRAYKNNIPGFGIGIRYKEDFSEETQEMKKEFTQAEEIIELLNMDMDTKEVFEDVIEARETYGIAYTEVVRNGAGEVVGIEFIKDTPTIEKTKPLNPRIDAEYFYKGKTITRPKKFCKYRQRVNGEEVYFKEFGDPRVMDKRSGEYADGEHVVDIENQANEILEFAIGTDVYGEVRWAGQILGIDGSRRAETLNNNYFENGRHTPLLIMLRGGTLTEESFHKLQEYMDGIKGEAGQHAFMILEAENNSNSTGIDEEKQPDIEVVPLASILQQDELFQEYLDNNRRRAQSSFQLPDLYVGYTTDFNRATAQTAMEVTEKQVFQPERRSLAWVVNNKLLIGYQFKYVEAYFLEPDITNPDDLAKILNVTERAGGLPPNKAKDITYTIMGDSAEPYEGDWGDIPLAYSKTQVSSSLLPQMDAQIKKAAASNNDAIVSVMKEVRALLKKMQDGGKAQ